MVVPFSPSLLQDNVTQTSFVISSRNKFMSTETITSTMANSNNETTETLTDKIGALSDLGPFLAQRNNAKNILYTSNIPQKCKDEPCMLGVDEAGRGPVLGPMVYGIAFCPLSDGEVLKTLGCADSKQLTEETRDTIFDDMNRKEYANTTVGWAVEAISPNTISRNMLKRTKYSLNELSMDSAIGLINAAIDLGVNIAEIYVDTVGPPEKYQAKLCALFPDFQITVAKKADSTYPIVSAASICAKVTRDHALKVWKFAEGLDTTHETFGSGYPNDPKTVSFLQESQDHYFGFPRIVRFSWSTAEKALSKLACPVAFEDGNEKPKAGRSIKKFFKGENGEKIEKSDFFKERFLESTNFEFM